MLFRDVYDLFVREGPPGGVIHLYDFLTWMPMTNQRQTAPQLGQAVNRTPRTYQAENPSFMDISRTKSNCPDPDGEAIRECWPVLIDEADQTGQAWSPQDRVMVYKEGSTAEVEARQGLISHPRLSIHYLDLDHDPLGFLIFLDHDPLGS